MVALPEPTVTTPFVDATPLLDQPEALQARAAADGVLFFRGRLQADAVADVATQVADVLIEFGLAEVDPSGQVVARTDHREASYWGTGVSKQTYSRVQALEAFHALAHHPALAEIYGALFGEQVLVHPRNIARLQIPSADAAPTPAHQDFIHIQGATNTWTAWVPLADCPAELGGLTVLAGSHREGVLDYRLAEGAGGLEAYTCGLDYVWVTGDYRAGDVITFHSQTVHKALPNLTNRVRLSADFRYQPVSQAVTRESLLPHGDDLRWEDLYLGWNDPNLQHYWGDLPLAVSRFDESLRWQKEHIC